MKTKLKKGNTVELITGADKGKSGEIIKFFPKSYSAIVKGINVKKKHQKQTQTQQAGIIEKEGKIHISNVAIVEPSQSKKSKIGFKFLKDGKKVRFYKSNSEVIDDK